MTESDTSRTGAREGGAVEPVAWRQEWTGVWVYAEEQHSSTDAPLYSQESIDTLRAQLEAAEKELRGYRLHVASFGRHVASVGCEYRQPFEGEEGDYLFNVRAETAEARAEAAEAEVARLKAACDRYSEEQTLHWEPMAVDAERYRWLRDRIGGRDHVEEDFSTHPGYSDDMTAEIDAAIDAARGEA